MTTQTNVWKRLQLKGDAFFTVCEEVLTFARPLVWLCIDMILVLFTTMMVLRRLAPDVVFSYTVVIFLPLTVAFITVFYQLYTTDYLQTAILFGLKRVAIGQAGLAYIHSMGTKGESVLLNRQIQDPWLHMWCLPGGYLNAEDKGKIVKTVRRRLIELVNPKWEFDLDVQIAKTSDTAAYRQLIQDLAYHPIKDYLFLVEHKEGDGALREEDISQHEHLKWWLVKDIKDGVVEVPPHMKDIILYLAGERRQPEYWELTSDYETYLLQRTSS